MCRYCQFDAGQPPVHSLPRHDWEDGDFVCCEVTGSANKLYRIELISGRRAAITPGDRVIGVLGRRAAALEFCGDWRACGADGAMHCLTAAGLFGALTSQSALQPRPMSVRYLGHIIGNDGTSPLRLADVVPDEAPAALTLPTVVVAGTSMSAGKTTTGRLAVRALSDAGYRVAGLKMIGAGGQKDTLIYQDAGAQFTRDFVDMGLPSTAVDDPAEVDAALKRMTGAVMRSSVDVVVAELGAGPHDPYHGDVALEIVRDAACYTILVASDGYAARGFCDALNLQPDVITGGAALTEAARHATTRLLPHLTVLDALSDEGQRALSDNLRAAVGKHVSVAAG